MLQTLLTTKYKAFDEIKTYFTTDVTKKNPNNERLGDPAGQNLHPIFRQKCLLNSYFWLAVWRIAPTERQLSLLPKELIIVLCLIQTLEQSSKVSVKSFETSCI